MKRNILLTALSVFVSAAMMLTSCTDDKEMITDQDITSADDDDAAAILFDQAFSEVDMVLEQLEFSWKNPGGLKSVTDTCPVIYVDHNDSVFWPKTVTIDFGTDGCTGPFGTVRKGKIIIVVTDRFWKEGSTRTVTFEEFSVNDFVVEGTKTITNQGRNNDENMVFSVVLTGGKVTNPEGKEITRDFTRTRTWIEGELTPRFRWDDIYLIEGEASGINRFGKSYTRTIIDPLMVKTACMWITSGMVEIVNYDVTSNTDGMVIDESSKIEILLDYGDGECDDKATITVNEETKEITLKGKKKRPKQ
jgi:hypothetical protein